MILSTGDRGERERKGERERESEGRRQKERKRREMSNEYLFKLLHYIHG